MDFKLACVLLAVASWLGDSDAWLFSSGGGGDSSVRRPHDIKTQSGLSSLYNQRVTHVDRVQRPLGSLSWMAGPLSHSGVVVTTETGDRWLVHKGNGYGGSGGQTVITDARHMSSRWRNRGGHDVHSSTVGDFVRAGGRDYSLPTDNCHHGASRMCSLQK